MAANDIKRAVGKRIREARIAAGLTQRALADKLGIGPQMVLLYESGANRVPLEREQRLADAIGVTVEYLHVGQPARPKRGSKAVLDRARALSNMEIRLLDEFSKIKDLQRKRLAINVLRAFGQS